jgi:hypothetical protein
VRRTCGTSTSITSPSDSWDLHQQLAAADIVVEEERPLQVGIERALHLARHDVEIFRLLEGPHDALAERHEQQQVLRGAAEDPVAMLVVGEVRPQRDQQAQVAHQQYGEAVGHVVASLAVEPPRRKCL